MITIERWPKVRHWLQQNIQDVGYLKLYLYFGNDASQQAIARMNLTNEEINHWLLEALDDLLDEGDADVIAKAMTRDCAGKPGHLHGTLDRLDDPSDEEDQIEQDDLPPGGRVIRQRFDPKNSDVGARTLIVEERVVRNQDEKSPDEEAEEVVVEDHELLPAPGGTIDENAADDEEPQEDGGDEDGGDEDGDGEDEDGDGEEADDEGVDVEEEDVIDDGITYSRADRIEAVRRWLYTFCDHNTASGKGERFRIFVHNALAENMTTFVIWSKSASQRDAERDAQSRSAISTLMEGRMSEPMVERPPAEPARKTTEERPVHAEQVVATEQDDGQDDEDGAAVDAELPIRTTTRSKGSDRTMTELEFFFARNILLEGLKLEMSLFRAAREMITTSTNIGRENTRQHVSTQKQMEKSLEQARASNSKLINTVAEQRLSQARLVAESEGVVTKESVKRDLGQVAITSFQSVLETIIKMRGLSRVQQQQQGGPPAGQPTPLGIPEPAPQPEQQSSEPDLGDWLMTRPDLIHALNQIDVRKNLTPETVRLLVDMSGGVSGLQPDAGEAAPSAPEHPATGDENP